MIKDSELAKETVFPILEDTVQNLKIQFGKYLIRSIKVEKANKSYKIAPTKS
ncbi:hypothetical protein [Paenibacillus castaneae]|uniref:hypothetical protein n=1 Tax=Paenibacillus castaneae TaxID=474957 RepID=UPI001ABBA758|nr:hypothetical protein [Paenibacillus castaneae]